MESGRRAFRCPPMEARPAPFWFWNDHLDADRLVSQFDRFLQAGMGGAVLHARGGLDPSEYMDQNWFNCVEAVVKRGAEAGATVWIYDELGWPSGTVAGRIPREHPELRMIHLRMEDVTLRESAQMPDCVSKDVVGAFHVSRSDPNRGFQRRHDGSALLQPDRIQCEPISLPVDPKIGPGQRILIFHQVPVDGALNYFDPKATAKFIELTHEEYYKRLGTHFGTTIRHAFMDEAGMFAGVASLPWDDGFDVEFQARRGYSLIPHLPALFFETPGHEAVRFDYWSLCAEKFREGFAIPMHTWCKAHRIAYSGHYLFEATLKEALRQLGSTMPLYEYQGLPGIDILGNDFYSRRFEQEAYGYYVVTIKQAASVDHQLGKGGLMSESYGVGGHAMGPEAMQTATNFQMALGVTYISQHAAFYSIRGERKLDCPPFIDWREPYWPFARKHFETIARTGWLLSQGEHVSDVLLLHPASSMQATYRHFRMREEYKAENYLFDADMPFELIDKHFTLLSVALLDAQIDHDYGDEEIMARHAAVEDGHFRVGARTYRIVVLPPLVNLRASTLALLREFASRGGMIVVVGSAAHLVDGRPSAEAVGFLAKHAVRIVDGVDRFDYRWVVDELTRRSARTVMLKTPAGEDTPAIKAQRRRWDGSDVLYLANISREPVTARMTLVPNATGCIEEWDPSTGKTWTVKPCRKGENLQLDIEWAPREARAFVTVPGDATVQPPAALRECQRIRPEWRGTRTGPNVLVLDECRVCGQDEVAPVPTPIWQARSLLKKRIEAAGAPAHFTTQYVIRVSTERPPSDACDLALELCPNARVRLNGETLPIEVVGSVLDPAISRIALPGLRPGENTLEITAVYADARTLDSPWLIGDFRLVTCDTVGFTVEGDAAGTKGMGIGSWPRSGAPFYAGTVIYRAEVDLDGLSPHSRVTLDLSGLAGSAEVRVNGCLVDHVLWPPYSCDITNAIREGGNTIEVEVANTLRNLLGPHYEPNEEIMTGMSDDSYRGAIGEPKRFLDYGLLAPPELAILV